jgi:hypothetical protein
MDSETTDPRPDWLTLDRDQRREIVLPLWLEGKSARDIAAKFQNATRNGIIGLVARAKLPKRANKVRDKVAPKTKKAKPAKSRYKPSIMPNPNRMAEPDLKPEPSFAWDRERPPLPGITPIGILSLPGRAGVLCRFPVIGGYCGAPSGEKMYCADHHGFVYSAQPPRAYVTKQKGGS